MYALIDNLDFFKAAYIHTTIERIKNVVFTGCLNNGLVLQFIKGFINFNLVFCSGP